MKVRMYMEEDEYTAEIAVQGIEPFILMLKKYGATDEDSNYYTVVDSSISFDVWQGVLDICFTKEGD